ncbi:hypothetical protein HA075_11990 [bacterium BFN5]|nr:hypothetical protein HA075_11880 [bacterium BFN5]QJW46485.1 hypothetical protein HA075_11990 [bacterium BFN5]
MKEQYIQAIQSILLQHATYAGDDACYTVAESILKDGFHWVREFSKQPSEATVVTMIHHLSRAATEQDKVVALMTLAFVLGTTKMPTDVATGLFDELLFRFFDNRASDEELTRLKAMVANLYQLATEYSPF